jgi:hypothetical protein
MAEDHWTGTFAGARDAATATHGEATMREAFREIVSGWTLIDGIDDLTDRIERAAVWTQANGPLEPDERATVELMIRAQVAHGMPDLIRAAGLQDEFGLPHEEDEEDEDEESREERLLNALGDSGVLHPGDDSG